MRTLILMRHAKSDWKQPDLADYDRPLNARGRGAVPVMAAHLQTQRVFAEVILTSSSARTLETVRLLQQTWAAEAEVLNEKALYLASPNEIAQHVQALHDSWTSAMVVAHNPGICALACHLAEEDLEMPTAAVVVLQADVDCWAGSIAGAKWQLAGYWKPKALEMEY